MTLRSALCEIITAALLIATGSSASGDEDIDLHGAVQDEVTVIEEDGSAPTDGEVGGHDYRYRYVVDCAAVENGLCSTPRACVSPRGTVRYSVYQSIDRGPFRFIGHLCLSPDQLGDGQPALTLAMVESEFRAVRWAEPALVVQPPDGRTLVNFDTNFYTELTEPAERTVHPLGIAVTIEATPTAYTWSWGDGSDPVTTTGPGAAYPDLKVTHRYADADAGVTVRPGVTVTYSGRYRIEGGPWQTIPETLDVAGPTVALRVLSATPVLVG